MSLNVVGNNYNLRSVQPLDQTKKTRQRIKGAAQQTLKEFTPLSRTKKTLSGMSHRPSKTVSKTKRAAEADLNPRASKKKKLPDSILVGLDQQVERTTRNMSMLCATIPGKIAGKKVLEQHLAVTQARKIPGLSQTDASSYEADFTLDGTRPNLAIIRINSQVGVGVFLKPDQKAIPKGALIGLYAGFFTISAKSEARNSAYLMGVSTEKLTKREIALITSSKPKTDGSCYQIDVDANFGGNFTRYINHSTYHGNLENRLIEYKRMLQVAFYAKKRINPGEQLLYSYGMQYWKQIGIKPSLMTPTTYKLTDKKMD